MEEPNQSQIIMKANFITHAAKCVTVCFGIEIEISNDCSCVRYRASNYLPSKGGTEYGRVSRWQEIKFSGERPYFIYHGRREFLDDYMRV